MNNVKEYVYSAKILQVRAVCQKPGSWKFLGKFRWHVHEQVYRQVRHGVNDRVSLRITEQVLLNETS